VIVALTPNLSLDRTLWLGGPLTPGHLHRVARVSVAAGGKGPNLARIVRALGGETCVAGVVAGFNGAHFRTLLTEEGLQGILEDTAGETRECQIMLSPDGSHPTEINEAGPLYAPDAVTRLLTRLPAGQVAVCGSLAPGTTREEFRAMLERLGTPVVDSSGLGLEAAIEARAALIKPNEHELEALTGRGDVESGRNLYARTGVPILLTRGAKGAAYIGAEVCEVAAPHIEVRNPVGSGDSLLGAFLYARGQGQPVPDALRLAVAAGSANALLGGPLHFDAAVARSLFSRTAVTVSA
jgi:tagatose 6-phosphate kinase